MSQTPTSPPPLTADQIRKHLLRADEVARRAMSLGRHPFGALLVGVPALGIPGFGLVVAVFALVSIASLAGERFVLKEVLVLSAILALGSYAAFVKLLGLQFPVWPAFITG